MFCQIDGSCAAHSGTPCYIKFVLVKRIFSEDLSLPSLCVDVAMGGNQLQQFVRLSREGHHAAASESWRLSASMSSAATVHSALRTKSTLAQLISWKLSHSSTMGVGDVDGGDGRRRKPR